MTTEKTYNGWTNYETWCVKLWMDNDQGSCEFWQEAARETWDGATASAYRTRSEDARYTLADQLKAEYEENTPEIDGVWMDLLRAAISEVDWDEIADALLDECQDEVDEDDEDAGEPEKYERR